VRYEKAESFSKKLDQNDPIKRCRDQFYIPQQDGQDEVYFCGNSLGLQPKLMADYLNLELEKWREKGVKGHFEGEFPWMPYHEFLTEGLAAIVGAKHSEVVAMNSLTVNLHLMMVSFFPADQKKI
jgi:kynureninase